MSKRVLIVDDSKTMRDLLNFTLSGAGYDVIQGVDGVDGLEVAEREEVDVVITDINMPRMDGFGLIEALRGHASYRSTPILVLTTETADDKKQRARSAGATGWIVKPFEPAKLLSVVERVMP